MKKLKFLVSVPDKYTGEQYEKGQVREFEDGRAEEILTAKRHDGSPYVEEVKEVEVAVKKTVKKETATKKTTKKAK